MTIEKFAEALDDAVRTAIESRNKYDYREGATRQEKKWADEEEAEARATLLALYAEALADAETVRLARSFSKRQPGTVEWSIAALYLHEHINRETK